MTDEILKHEYIAYNIVNMAGQIGGLFKVLFISFSIVAMYINDKVVTAKLIRSLYFIDKPV